MAPSRGLGLILQKQRISYICRQCQIRTLTSSPKSPSGHNRWSKIKHDKARVDAVKNRQRAAFSQELTLASKLGGPDTAHNPRLVDLITKAKREGMAKTSIEAAIARGQGRSLSGASLESVTIEAMMPGNVGAVIESETDNRLRTLQEVRLIIKNAGGSTTPSRYLFQKKGRVTFEAKDGVGLDEILEAALDSGAMDVDEGENGRLVVWTEPEQTQSVGDQVAKTLDLQVATSEILWEPNEETKVELAGEDEAQELATFVDLLHEEGTVQGVAMNIAQGSISSESWKELYTRLSN
ncbi:Hypothetical protein R9X50_00412000 [Acrodontium crateriforme]|uniref:Uncharacterized protein n=1 Tax=Acrodontium crateriforme TaxID=150365 RepID=A0AAQ3M5H3_9PEZI|nr:Hypothetical protein R9X50_00412000 [Acrodontium crateriforme]